MHEVNELLSGASYVYPIMNACMHEWVNGWMDEWQMDRWMDGWMNGWMDEWQMDRWMADG